MDECPRCNIPLLFGCASVSCPMCGWNRAQYGRIDAPWYKQPGVKTRLSHAVLDELRKQSGVKR
jgi:uncharacterized Zn finger protein (UPF0148 family)